MRLRVAIVGIALVVVSQHVGAQALTFTGESQPGIPIQLPEEIWSYDPTPGAQHPYLIGRRKLNSSNSLSISWDGRLILYLDYHNTLFASGVRPPGTDVGGFIFATFDPSQISGSPPNFAGAIGTPFPRFARINMGTDPSLHPGNSYPNHPTYSSPYPLIAPQPGQTIGSMGELGLLNIESLSANIFPVPESELPAAAASQNPFPSDAQGTPNLTGSFMTYHCVITFQDQPRFWDPAASGGQGQWVQLRDGRYEAGTYANGITLSNPGSFMKRNGRARLSVTVDHAAGTVQRVDVLEKWAPFEVHDPAWTTTPSGVTVGDSVPSLTTMWADNFEPSLTQDGHFMIGKGSTMLVRGGRGNSRVVFYFNDTAFGTTGWQGPYELHYLHMMRNEDVDGQTLAERYPIARQPIQDYDGTVLGDVDGDGDFDDADILAGPLVPFEGGYNWISPDGRYVIYCVASGGVGDNHPEIPINAWNNKPIITDGGGTSNRAQVSVVGSVTGWQCWRIDHSAANPSRHMFTAWDAESRSTYLRTASLGFSPGFWDLLRGTSALPIRADDHLKLHLINSNRQLYYEVDLSPYSERDYGFYLPMTVMLDLDTSHSLHDIHRTVDITRTPDLSGNGHFGQVLGAMLPCEYFGLPTEINQGPESPQMPYNKNVPGLYVPAQPGELSAGMQATAISTPQGDWIPLADWKDGKPDVNNPGSLTTPYAGRGLAHDMDSDDCWGKVGQAMFFEDGAAVTIDNSNQPPELNPGTTVPGASRSLTASLWVHPLLDRSCTVQLALHNYVIELEPNGALTGGVQDPSGAWHRVSSAAGTASLGSWTHVAVVWQPTAPTDSDVVSELLLFVKGAQVASVPLKFANLALNTGQIRIGCLQACAQGSGATLLLDEVALKNSAMTDSQISNLALQLIVPTTWTPDPSLPAPLAPFQAGDERVPTSNPYSQAAANLGADLFHDVQLSVTKDMSCATCHQPENAFTDGLEVAIGQGDVPLLRNTPSIFNLRYTVDQFWDSRAEDLEDQALQPIFEPTEMGMTWSDVKSYLEGDADYLNAFNSVYQAGGSITQDHVRNALASFQRSVAAGAAPADLAGPHGAGLQPDERNGRNLFFGKARCSGCHNGPNFTDGRLWTTGTWREDGTDDGAYRPDAGTATAGKARFFGAFKTPSLRELASTGPYFHDGHAETLTEVVEFYNAGGERQDHLGFKISQFAHTFVAEETNRRLGLTEQEIADLVAYLDALSGGTIEVLGVGSNNVPSLTATVVASATPGFDDVTIQVTDPDGQGDLDSTMLWTLELEAEPWPYGSFVTMDWNDVTQVTPIANGYQATLTIPEGEFFRGRAADHHGVWGGWSNRPPSITSVVSENPGIPGWDDLTVTVTDPDGQSDLDPTDFSSLEITLEFPVGNFIVVDWYSFAATISVVPGGYQGVVQVPNGTLRSSRAHDIHNRWSRWANRAPEVAFQLTPSSTVPGWDDLTVTVTDPDGQGDIDPTDLGSLYLEANVLGQIVAVDWSFFANPPSTLAPISGGYQATAPVPPGTQVTSLLAGDRFGLWSLSIP